MEERQEQTHYVKRVVLPSGKSIEVVYFRESPGAEASEQLAPPRDPVPQLPAEPAEDLHVCLDCSSPLVHPVEWEQVGEDRWRVLLRCPNCEIHREGVFTQRTVEDFDEELERGSDAVARDYGRLMRANMGDEIERFAAALDADAILPEDF
jgi:hypothetical protein